MRRQDLEALDASCASDLDRYLLTPKQSLTALEAQKRAFVSEVSNVTTKRDALHTRCRALMCKRVKALLLEAPGVAHLRRCYGDAPEQPQKRTAPETTLV